LLLEEASIYLATFYSNLKIKNYLKKIIMFMLEYIYQTSN
jgi:hypothetical protein